MASRDNSEYPSTISKFKRKYTNWRLDTIHTLPPQELDLSGSHWDIQQLRACRVVLKDGYECLPILTSHLSAARNTVRRTGIVIRDFSKDELQKMTHKELRYNGGSFDSFFVLLADVVEPPRKEWNVRKARKDIAAPQRLLNEITEPGSSPSNHRSSPSLPPSSQSYAQDPNEATERLDHVERAKHETVCASMATEFISSVLDLYANPVSNTDVMELSNAPMGFFVGGAVFNSTCQTDGAMIFKSLDTEHGTWHSGREALCAFEAKAQYTEWVDRDSNEGRTSPQVLAQQVCEMLGVLCSRVQDDRYDLLSDID
jgi:hypothetical protein